MIRNLDKYRIHILCEDQKHYYFIRSFLLSQGVKNNHKFDSIDLPEGSQSGKQFVREHFIKDYQKYTRSRENKILIVVQDIDKDDKTFALVKNDYSLLVQKAGLGSINDFDKLLFVFPKRNIETWLVWFGRENINNKINEVTNFKLVNNLISPADAGKRASNLYTKSRTDESVCINAPKSLIFACTEFESLCEKL